MNMNIIEEGDDDDVGGGGGNNMQQRDSSSNDNSIMNIDVDHNNHNHDQRLREMQVSIAASASVFPGFRFSPTDHELISYYLKKKLQGSDTCVNIIREVDFCRHEPWDLPALSIIRSENEWFFFSARGRKYPNGSQSKRATQSGYWKATGKERDVKSGGSAIGTKRTLVFHTGRAPKGERTEWIMHEYCMSDTTQESLVVCRLRRNGDFHLTESPKGSSDHRNLSTTDDGHSGMNENANTQLDGFDIGNAIKSYSKESTSGYRSRSVARNDSETDSDQQLFPDSPHGSSTPYKDCDYDDDCFADIINDDIIKLDESASHSLTLHGVLSGDLLSTKCMEKLPQEMVSSQGTAGRRIKLKRQKIQNPAHDQRTSSDHVDRDQLQHEKPTSGCVAEKMTPGCVISVLAGNSSRVSGLTHLVLVFFLLLILFVAYWHFNNSNKQYLGISMEVSKRQLRYWLHKAADYI